MYITNSAIYGYYGLRIEKIGLIVQNIKYTNKLWHNLIKLNLNFSDYSGAPRAAQLQNITPLSISPTVENTPLCSAGALEKVDGLCHGISEEGLRLQQLVYEHKVGF